MAITANRFPFIRATLLYAAEESVPARQHGDANMLVLGADVTCADDAEEILKIFLTAAALATATPSVAHDWPGAKSQNYDHETMWPAIAGPDTCGFH